MVTLHRALGHFGCFHVDDLHAHRGLDVAEANLFRTALDAQSIAELYEAGRP